MTQYVEHRVAGQPMIVSEEETNVLMEQIMYIWSQKFKVCVRVCYILMCTQYCMCFSPILSCYYGTRVCLTSLF